LTSLPNPVSSSYRRPRQSNFNTDRDGTFGLIGDSLNPIADVVRHSKIEWIGVRHEEGAALAAAGQAKLSGRLGVCCGTTGPGSTHLVAGLYEASRDHAPVLALNTLWSGNWIRQSGEQRIIGSFNNGAVGTALGQANGIQALDRSRQVIALCGDGGFNMLMCEFLTAVQHKLPVKALVYNNSSLGLIVLEAEAIAVPAWKQAIDFPNPDYAALARACGAVGFKAEKPGKLRDAIDKALKADGPAIADCVVAANEMPNVPHLELGTIGNYAEAKVKEAVLAVTGG
jgi:thiamine pyrophosphate-dependent acetolactate synthase large subunit-like protein